MPDTLDARQQWRRGTAALWTAEDPTLEAGEAGYETDTGRIKIGDGATAWTTLSYWSPPALRLETDLPAAGALSALKLVRVNSSGRVELAAPTDGQAGKLLGMTTTSASAIDEMVVVLRAGEVVDGSWAWTPGTVLFLGAAGALTATPVTTGYLQMVGLALTATSVFLDIHEPTVRP